ncbi:MAG: PEP-CTERM sorting domain-containing protein [Verrucomicrobiales bacterium]|nr:PEP-CTERM sorting domain-containing protein [Verrucomicrobiales bacterium]
MKFTGGSGLCAVLSPGGNKNTAGWWSYGSAAGLGTEYGHYELGADSNMVDNDQTLLTAQASDIANYLNTNKNTWMRLEFALYDWAGTATFSLDNLTVGLIPEPSTYALLIIGLSLSAACVFLRRHRRLS